MSATCVPPESSSGSSCCSKNKCHARRLRTLIPALLALLAIAALSTWLMCSSMGMGMGDVAAEVGTGLWKRQNASSGSEDSPFVRNKLYLIFGAAAAHSKTRSVALVTYALAVVALLAWNALDADYAVRAWTK
ncbi:hypothetical protein RhiJN_18854 [Ceratobasidium sp. AG-Ba]|nr:hypothetical protein RhiJN_04035 [Ceratobasidium sp. AG-Ba]QRV90836.1 hypothetical protein RhiJN_18854 [Ceratobasidium sp. AG-Ba]